MNKIAKALVQVGEDDSEILIRPCFPVNIRLMRTNVGYFNVVAQVINHMKGVIQTKFSDYTALQGISGANVGIPFNIIIIYYDGKLLTMLNPVIISKSKETKTTLSNCGSINLKEPIKVTRHISVTVRYVPFIDASCLEYEEKVFKSGTVQHEIEHNLGILITNKKEIKNESV